MALRDYQEAARDAVVAAWGIKPWWDGESETYRTVICNLPTGSGKTYVSGAIFEELRKQGRCLFVADQDELTAQPLASFRKHHGITASLEKADSRASRMSEVVVASAQTLCRPDRLERFTPNHFDFVIVDEAHRGSDRNQKITDYFANAKVCGITATAFRAKLADLSNWYEYVAFEMGPLDLIDEGYLAPIKVLTLPVLVNIQEVRQKMAADGMDYDKEELSTTIRPYFEAIADLIIEHAPDRQIVAFLPLIASSQAFAAVCRAKGLNARHVDGKSPDRGQILEAFARKQFNIICNSNLLGTGWDCPAADCLLNISPTRSALVFRQRVGRILRTLPETVDGVPTKEERKVRIAASAKQDCLLLDLLWQAGRFGLMGPADLIAGNADERLAIQLRLDRLRVPADLQGVSAEVQADREQALKKALVDAAKRRSTFNDAINLIAARLHGRKVLNYEPVMKWEGKAVTEKQKEWMQRNSIDPESAKDRGHVSALMNLLFNRRRAGLCSHKVVEALEERGIAGAISFTDWNAYHILGGNYPFPFGNPARKGLALRQVSSGFWRWCKEQPWIKTQYPIVWDWMTSVLDPEAKTKEEGMCRCIGAHQAPNCPVHPLAPMPLGQPRAFEPGKLGEARRQERARVVAEDFDCLDS